MPSPLKRSSPGRLLASLCSPARAGPLPVRTGFPTSLADLVVKNHGRLKKPKRRRPSTAPSSPAPPVAAAEPPPELSPVQDAPRRKGAAFSLRPELLALGGAVALALIVIWSKRLVAAVTVASLSLLWIESVRSASRRRPRPRPSETTELLVLCGRGRVSPIREVESETETPRSSCADPDKGREVSSLWTGERSDLGGDDSISSERKEKRSLRKLIAKKLHSGKKQPKKKDPSGKQPDAAGEVGSNAGPVKTEPLVASTEQTPLESSKEEGEELDGRGGAALPFAAFIPVVLDSS